MEIKKSCGLIFICNNQILLFHPTNSSSGFQFAKGGIQENETEFKCAVRETYEEIGTELNRLVIDCTKEIERIEIEYTDKQGKVYKIVVGFVIFVKELFTDFNFSLFPMESGVNEMDEGQWFSKEEAEKVIFWRMKLILKFLN